MDKPERGDSLAEVRVADTSDVGIAALFLLGDRERFCVGFGTPPVVVDLIVVP
jgi:hypothetical protein